MRPAYKVQLLNMAGGQDSSFLGKSKRLGTTQSLETEVPNILSTVRQAWQSPSENITSNGANLELDSRDMSEVRAKLQGQKILH